MLSEYPVTRQPLVSHQVRTPTMVANETVQQIHNALGSIPRGSQEQVARLYSRLLRDHELSNATDWPALNTAILERWNMQGLRHVKALAWKYASQAQPQ